MYGWYTKGAIRLIENWLVSDHFNRKQFAAEARILVSSENQMQDRAEREP